LIANGIRAATRWEISYKIIYNSGNEFTRRLLIAGLDADNPLLLRQGRLFEGA